MMICGKDISIEETKYEVSRIREILSYFLFVFFFPFFFLLLKLDIEWGHWVLSCIQHKITNHI